MSDTLVPDQTYTYEGTHYRAGREMPHEVAEALGLVESGEQSDEEGQESEEQEESPEYLPQDFPKRDLLVEDGLTTLQGVDEASDDRLDEITGVGPASIEDIRSALDDHLG